jgi:hypothetical protein
MDLCADWFSGNTVLQLPGRPQITDLKKTQAYLVEADEEVYIKASIPFVGGVLVKTYAFSKTKPEWREEFHFQVPKLPIGSLRLGFLTFQHLDGDLQVSTHLGGRHAESLKIPDFDFDHGSAVNSWVSSNQGLGMTENEIEVRTQSHALRIRLEASTLRPLAMLEHHKTREGRFLRLYFSVSEFDETRKGDWDFSSETIRFAFRLENA